MKIIIEHRNTKRKIEGPFNICGSRVDLRRFAELILEGIHGPLTAVSETDVERVGSFCYGWISVTDPEPKQERLANTEPLEWDR